MNRPQTNPGQFLAPFLDPGIFSRETVSVHTYGVRSTTPSPAGNTPGGWRGERAKPNSACFSPRSSSTVNRLLSIDSHANACLWIIAREVPWCCTWDPGPPLFCAVRNTTDTSMWICE
ncbi:hypothetical protein CTAM01_01564 [Colletotrichum tamarilloi]|uniref:Uncharacterized protein n=1 Tax=Colletotrichum tamarilloi TaxID=1209934 RepID=A0ABQ9RSB1_9PEZI|nr:uncharacterized protein CTAM01_01564 [Colletotrichum tamarilloi]KAK1510991.1 hypothetical protein CTAM01_01564 [Colletotrichum tamarilloi]